MCAELHSDGRLITSHVETIVLRFLRRGAARRWLRIVDKIRRLATKAPAWWIASEIKSYRRRLGAHATRSRPWRGHIFALLMFRHRDDRLHSGTECRLLGNRLIRHRCALPRPRRSANKSCPHVDFSQPLSHIMSPCDRKQWTQTKKSEIICSTKKSETKSRST